MLFIKMKLDTNKNINGCYDPIFIVDQPQLLSRTGIGLIIRSYNSQLKLYQWQGQLRLIGLINIRPGLLIIWKQTTNNEQYITFSFRTKKNRNVVSVWDTIVFQPCFNHGFDLTSEFIHSDLQIFIQWLVLWQFDNQTQ